MKNTVRPVNNPLLDPPVLPYRAPPLDMVKPEHVLPAVRFAIAEVKEAIDAIRDEAAPASFANTIEKLERSDRALDRILSVFSHFTGAYKTPEFAALEQDVWGDVTRHGIDVLQDAALFKRVKAVKDSPAIVAALEDDQKVLLDKQYDYFVDAGAELTPDKKARLKEIGERLEVVTTEFRSNVVDATAAFEKYVTDEAALTGLPDETKKRYAARATGKGKPGTWLIELSPPPTEIAEYAENRQLREEIFRARMRVGSVAPFDNRGRVLEIVALRDEQAKLMGFSTYADFVLKDRMLDSPAAVAQLLEANAVAYKAAFDREIKEVQAYALAQDNLAAEDFSHWDYAFYARKLKEETFSINLEETRNYFKLENVVKGAHQLAEELFDVTLVETSGKYPVNDSDIKVLEVQERGGAVIGLLYTDYYARPGLKDNGAWMSELQSRGVDAAGETYLPIVGNTCNFARPEAGKPALLTKDQVDTVFHEFGHALHGLLTQARYTSLAGTRVKRDFVEVPSQFLENYVLEPRILDIYAKHHETGARIPQEMVDKIVKVETFGAGYQGLRQTFFGQLDLAWHTVDPAVAAQKGVEAFEDDILAQNGSFPRVEGAQSPAFGHIFSGGYAVGYYGYKNAEVIDAAMMEKMRDSGDVFHPVLSKALRHGIFAAGGMREPDELTQDFLGAAPDPAALFRREGLAPPRVVEKPPE